MQMRNHHKSLFASSILGLAYPLSATAQLAADAPSAAGAAVQTIVITGDAFSKTDGFLARQSSTGTRFPVDIEKLPNTIRVLPQQLFEAAQATLPQDATKYVAGVQALPGFGTNVGYVIRGFFANYEILQNGVRSGDSPGDLSNVERIEILKGPIASLYGGTGAFAGNVNIITKRPLKTFAGSLRVQAGSDKFYRTDLDLGGPLNTAGSLRYRMTAAAEDAGSFRDAVKSNKRIVSPSLEWVVSDRIKLRLDTSAMNRKYLFEEGQLADPVTFSTPLSRTYFPSNSTPTRERFHSLGLEGEFKLTEGLSLRLAGLGSDYDIDIGSSRLSVALQPDGRTLNRSTTEGPQRSQRHVVQADLIYRSALLGQETVFLLGAEQFRNRYDYDASSRSLPKLDLFTPGNAPAPVLPLQPQFAGFSAYRGSAVYGQVFTQFSGRLAGLVGVRYDRQTNEGEFNGSGAKISDQQPSPRIGLTYRVSEGSTLFGNWATSFSPNFALDRDGDVFAADRVRQVEAGVRHSFAQGRALVTFAVFDVRRSNVVIPDITAFAQSIAGGVQTSRGAEVDITGRVTRQLDLIANYARTRSRVADPRDPNFGQTLPAVARDAASLFLVYRMADGLKGLSTSAGVVHNSAIQATLPNTVVIPGSTRLDLGMAYEWDGWRVQANLNNATNNKSYTTNLFSLSPLPPRQLALNVATRF